MLEPEARGRGMGGWRQFTESDMADTSLQYFLVNEFWLQARVAASVAGEEIG